MKTFAELTDQARLVRALMNVIQRALNVKEKRKEKKMLKKRHVCSHSLSGFSHECDKIFMRP